MDDWNARLFAATATLGTGASFCATLEGSLVFLRPLTPAAEAWLRDAVDNEAQWVADSLVVEENYFGPLAEGIIDAGFTFETDPLPN